MSSREIAALIKMLNIAHFLVVFSLALNVSLASKRESSKTDKDHNNTYPREHGSAGPSQMDQDLVPICSLALARVLLPSPKTYPRFDELALFYRSAMSRASSRLEAARLLCLSHFLIRLPNEYRSMTKLIDSFGEVGLSIFTRYSAIRLVAILDKTIAEPCQGEEIFPYHHTLASILKYCLRIVTFGIFLELSLADSTRGRKAANRLIATADFLMVLVEVKIAQSDRFKGYLPFVITLRAYLIWFLRYL